MHHIVGIHEWTGNAKFHRCSHEPVIDGDDTTLYLVQDSPAFSALKSVVAARHVLHALPQLTKFCHTGQLEVFHSCLLKYCPKRQHFFYEGICCKIHCNNSTPSLLWQGNMITSPVKLFFHHMVTHTRKCVLWPEINSCHTLGIPDSIYDFIKLAPSCFFTYLQWGIFSLSKIVWFFLFQILPIHSNILIHGRIYS